MDNLVTTLILDFSKKLFLQLNYLPFEQKHKSIGIQDAR